MSEEIKISSFMKIILLIFSCPSGLQWLIVKKNAPKIKTFPRTYSKHLLDFYWYLKQYVTLLIFAVHRQNIFSKLCRLSRG